MTQCWPLQGMSAAQKAVLISLADNANDEGVCWPAISTIVKRTCLSERAVRNAIRWLEDSKVIASHQRHGRSTWYTVTPASYTPGTSCPPAPDAPRTVKEPSIEPQEGASAPVAKSPRKVSVPVQAIVDLFNETLPELPTVVLINKGRQATVKARWNDSEVHQDLDFWRDFFESVRSSDFLMGKTQGRDGKPFRCSFDWLLCPSNFVKVVEGNYHA
jgi:hypothetical protein